MSRTSRRGLSLVASALALCLVQPLARAETNERWAVLILGATEADSELADNVTEVVIARIAQRKGVELSGTAEFRQKLRLSNLWEAQACLDNPGCAGRVAVSLGVGWVATGTVGRRGPQFLFSLALKNVQSKRTERDVFRLIEGSADDLVQAVLQATDALFEPRSDPGKLVVQSSPPAARIMVDGAYLGRTPLISGPLVPGPHKVRAERSGHFPWSSDIEVPAGRALEISLRPENLPVRYRWPTYAATGTAITSGVALAAGVALGLAARIDPTAPRRADAQRQFEQRRDFGMTADILLLAGGALAAASAYLLIHYRRHIFGPAPDAD